MIWEWKKTTRVKPGGQVEISVPDLVEGEAVDVLVRRASKHEVSGKRPGYGVARGKITVSNDFDEPLHDFDEYQ